MNTDRESESNQSSDREGIKAQQIKLPKGGGAIKGLGETFTPDAFSGTGSYSIPFPLTPARGYEPHVALNYQSGSGNGPFGLGFSLPLSKISRRTEKNGIPRYNSKDIFVYGGEELVRAKTTQSGNWRIDRYRPRIEQAFSEIQHWVNTGTSDSYWQIVTRSNTTLVYGKSDTAKIFDPNDPTKIFEWLVEHSTDSKGNTIQYKYKAENDENVPNVPWEQGCALSAKYIQSVQYGNYLDQTIQEEKFAFEVVFDYGEYDISDLEKGGKNPHKPKNKWDYRPDAFSSYRSGFEIRTRRRCKNILLFHHFEKELGDPCLAKSLGISYADKNNCHTANPAHFSLVRSVQLTGYRRDGKIATDKYDLKSMPPLDVTFSGFQPPRDPRFRPLTIAGDNAEDLPSAGFQPVDMEGEGIAGLLSSDAYAIWYLSPEGEGGYAPPQSPESFPIDRSFGEGGASFKDLEGNGKLDLVVTDSARNGFYQRQDDGSWGKFTPFAQYPNNENAAYMEAVDLSADGKTDTLVVEENCLLVYPSLGKGGYAQPVSLPKPDGFPVQEPANKKAMVTFADLFGDGLSHRVKIGNGSIECWPDLGYGRFGEKIILGNAPVFDENFDIARLHLADVDGSGAQDLVYVYPDRVALFLNRSGNDFSDAITVKLPETCTDIDKINFADILGNGTTCLTFTKVGPEPRHYFYNFVGETALDGQQVKSLKPYLLNEINNNLGAITQIHYTSSTQFYLADKKAGRPWITKLYFPVQVVEKVTAIDEISGAKFVHRFAYHDGFYDTVENEFRGFGYVESWDTQTYKEYQHNTSDHRIKKELYVPPVYTRSWYHTGVFNNYDAVRAYYKNEYYKGDAKAYNLPDSVLPSPADMDPETLRQAKAAIKGHVIRQEVYGQDGSSDADKPYTVDESNFEVRLLQPVDEENPFAVFMVLPRENIAYHYERNPADPRIQQSFTIKVDPYGNVEESCEIFLPRRSQQSSVNVYPEQQEFKATLDVDSFINEITGFRLIGVNYESREFELCGLQLPEGSEYFSFEDIHTKVKKALKSIVQYDGALNGNVQARQLSWSRKFFWDEQQINVLPLRKISPRALLHHQEEAAFPQSFLQDVFANRLTPEAITNLCGYFFDEKSGYYWNRGLVQHYFKPNENFFMIHKTENSFVEPTSSLYSKTTLDYDNYHMYPV